MFKQFAKVEENKISFELKTFNIESKIFKSSLILNAIELLTGDRNNVQKINIEDILKMADRKVGNKQIQINKKIVASINKGHLELNLCEK